MNKLWAGEPGALLDQSKATVPMWCFQADRTTTNSTCSFAAWQVWKKALPGGAAAVMLVNNGREVADVSVVRKTPVSRQFNTTMRLSIGQNGSIFIGNLGLFWIYFEELQTQVRTINLPRQARDNHEEQLRKRGVFCRSLLRSVCPAPLASRAGREIYGSIRISAR